MGKVFVYLRSNIQWEGMTQDNFLLQTGTSLGISSDQLRKVERAIEIWDAEYRLSYSSYRQRLKEIGDYSRSVMTGLDGIFLSYYGVEWLIRSGEPAWIIPVDDDDWHIPDLADRLRATSSQFVYWDIDRIIHCWNIGDNEPALSHQKPLANYKCLLTNAYAVHTSALQQLPRDEQRKVLDHHGRALSVASRHIDTSYISYIPETLGATYKSPASFTKVTGPTSAVTMTDMVNSSNRFNMRLFDNHWALPMLKRSVRLIELLQSTNQNSTRAV